MEQSLSKFGFRTWVTIIIVMIVVVLFGLYVANEQKVIRDAEVRAARNLVVMAESVRQNMATKWELGLFSTEDMVETMARDDLSQDQKMSMLLASVPVVSAWESAKAKAKDGGFEFRTPRVGARNPDNEPDEIEREALAYFEKNPSEDEHVIIDDAANTIRYFRPVRFDEVCMSCHGDPATSQEIWGRSDGKDITGFRMDNKRPGDMHGAFEVIRPLDDADALIRNTVLMGIAGIIPIVLAALWFVQKVARVLFVNPLADAAETCARIADGDLTQDIQANSNDEVGRLMKALSQMNRNLGDLVSNVRGGVSEVIRSSSEIAAGNLELSSRTEQQAASLEQTAASMDEMTSTVQQNADNARQASTLVEEARNRANQGREVSERTVSAMAEINHSSKRISDIIGVIDEIAFQTNLLALNAAVEAARAGEQGRGFAVVASEVRNLAQRSATAAKEIKSLINDSVEKVEMGTELVNRTGNSLTEIAQSVTNVSTMIAEIAAASSEQSDGITQVNQAVAQMDQVTQQNAALVEQSSAAAKSLESLAQELDGTVSRFQVSDGGVTHRRPAPAIAAPSRPSSPRPAAKISAPKPASRPAPQIQSKDGDDQDWEEF